MQILRDPALQGPEKEAARKQKVRKLIATRFNYAEMATRSLGSHWDKLTRKTMYTGESVNRPRAVVNTVIVDERGDRLPVDYQLQCPHGQWELIDVVIDEVSIVRTYRSQFNKVIQTSSFDALVKRMRVKRDEQ
jgi:phospholipid transport system substrate-binding protein